MAYRNELDAAHAQVDALREEMSVLREENRKLGEIRNPKGSRKKVVVPRSGFRYEKPKTLWPMFDDWHEMVAFFSVADSDSVLAWIGSRLGFLTAILFFTPNIALISILILPFVILSGFKIGRAPKTP